MTRAATSPELAYYRSSGKGALVYAAVLKPPTIYTARVNQTFSTLDQVVVIVYDGGSGTLADVLPDMEVWVGSTAGSWDKGMCRLRDKDATHFYLSETSEISFADNDYITIVANFCVWARPVRIETNGTVYMDEITYTNQHLNWDPQPNMGSHKVVEMTGSTVVTNWVGSSSFCPGSSISSYAWSCSTASASSGTTTATPSFTFNTVGWHIVYLTVTAANGKSFFGVRYVYVWNSSNMPPLAQIDELSGDVESGGWKATITLKEGATYSSFYDRAMVIIFVKEYYDGTQINIGAVVGSENIRFVGWIAEEENILDSEQGSLTFTAYGAAHWMTLIPSWPDGVELVSAASGWTNVASLTVDLGVYHFLRWRSTITRVADVTLTSDTRLTQEVSSSAQNLWSQIQEMTWAQIYARPGFNPQGQLSISIHPNLIPYASRTFPTVMTLTQSDIHDGISFQRVIVPEVGIVDMSGVIVTGPTVGQAKFALAPGHSLPHYGAWELQPNLLLSSQSQVITLSGLYRSWRNNPFPSIPLSLAAPISLIDLFPNQRCSISISTSDNIRGWAYSGGLIPLSVSYVHDPESGYLYASVVFEGETVESEARQGDTPGSVDTDNPPSPSFPPLPDIPVIIPGVPEPSANGPTVAVIHDTNVGFMYSVDFDAASPTWLFFNSGLTSTQYGAANRFFRTPSGACYCAYVNAQNTGTGSTFLARAPSLGGAWTVLYDQTNLVPTGSNVWGVMGLGINTLLPDTMGAVLQFGNDQIPRFYLGTSGTFGGGTALAGTYAYTWWVSYGLSKWMCTSYGNQANGKVRILPASGASVTSPATPTNMDRPHIRASSTGVTFHDIQFANNIAIGSNNMTSYSTVSLSHTIDFYDGFGSPEYIDCSPTGLYLMTRGDTGARIRSSDGGTTWAGIPNLPVGSWWFSFAGPTSRFCAAGGSSIRYSPDFGVTWYNKEGNVTGLVALPDINMIKVLSY